MKLRKITNKNAARIKINIDRYQRPFVWNIDNIKALKESIDEGLFYGAGTYIEREDKSIDIVDGQQRLIAIAMMSSKKSLKFNFQFKNYDKRLNAIINGNFKEIKLDDSSSNAYLKLMMGLKKKIIEESITIDKFSIPFLSIEKEQVIKSFVSMNTHGSNVKSHDIYKALLLIGNHEDAFEEAVNDKWIPILNAYYHLLQDSEIESKPPMEMLFTQAFNTQLGNKKINKRKKFISQSFNKWKEEEVEIDFLKTVLKYLEWAKRNLREPKGKTLFSLEKLSLRDSNGAINGLSSILSFKWSSLTGVNNKMKYEIFSLLHSINVLISIGDIPKNRYKPIIAEAVKVFNEKSAKEVKYLKTKAILRDFYNKNVLTVSQFNNKFKSHIAIYSNKKNAYKNILSKDATHLLNYLVPLMNKQEIPDLKFMTDLNPTWNIEHILNDVKEYDNLFFMTLMDKKLNSKLKNKKLFDKISLLNKGDFIEHPLFSLKEDAKEPTPENYLNLISLNR